MLTKWLLDCSGWLLGEVVVGGYLVVVFHLFIYFFWKTHKNEGQAVAIYSDDENACTVSGELTDVRASQGACRCS